MGVGGKGFLLFAHLQPDTPGKLFAHALSYEGLEFASTSFCVAWRSGRETTTSSRRHAGSGARSGR